MSTGRRRSPPGCTLAEVVGAFAVAIAAATALSLTEVRFIADHLATLIAGLFVLLPLFLLRHRGAIESYGFTTQPLALGLALAGGAMVLLLPPFALAFAALVRLGCALHPALVGGACDLVRHPQLRLPEPFWSTAASQLVVVALPEELFFRGYLQGRLDDAFVPRWRLLGAQVGPGWLVAALLFGLGHVCVYGDLQMLTRVAPGLVFGWLFARTGSILPSTLFHAACNLAMKTLVASYFG